LYGLSRVPSSENKLPGVPREDLGSTSSVLLRTYALYRSSVLCNVTAPPAVFPSWIEEHEVVEVDGKRSVRAFRGCFPYTTCRSGGCLRCGRGRGWPGETLCLYVGYPGVMGQDLGKNWECGVEEWRSLAVLYSYARGCPERTSLERTLI
jgi:hypothetical protein